MTNHELLDMIGEVKEEYVQEADGNVIRPRFGWKALAGLAACGLLVLAAYPAYRAANPPLHDYAVVENGAVMADMAEGQANTTAGEIADSPAGDGGGTEEAAPEEVPPVLSAPAPDAAVPDAPEAAPVDPEYSVGSSNEAHAGGSEDAAGADSFDGAEYWVGNAPEQAQEYPAWFGGSWIDNDYNPSRLSVAIVDGFRTPELEAEIRERYGDQEILLSTVKYSLNELTKLRDDVTRLFEELDYHGYLGYGVRQMENRVHIDLSEEPSGQLLSALAELDPDGDAILVRVFKGASISPDSDVPLSTPSGADE